MDLKNGAIDPPNYNTINHDKSIKDLEEEFMENENSAVIKKKYSPLLRQCLAVSGPIVATIGAGMTAGYSAVLLPQLKTEHSIIKIDEEMASWIASLVALPMAVGCIIAGWLIERFGRRKTIFMISIPFIIGWVLISFSTNIAMLLIGRFLTGTCAGLLGPSTAIYLGEVSAPKYRGTFLAGVALAISLGLFLVHLLGTFLSWQLTASLCALTPLACYVLIMMVPETPAWLAKMDRLKDAEESFRWLRGSDDQSINEMTTMFRKHIELKPSTNVNPPLSILFEQITRPECWKPLIIINVYICITQFAGINVVAFYSVTIMKNTVGKGMNEYLAMIIIDSLRLLMSILACFLTRNYGRRPLSLISGAGTTISLFCLATNLHFFSQNPWFAMISFISYIIFISVGLVPLPWILMGEIYPLAVRGFGSGVTSALAFIACFVVLKTLPGMILNFGIGGTFFVYGSFALGGTIFLFFFLPETRNKTLQHIEEYYAKKTKIDIKNSI